MIVRILRPQCCGHGQCAEIAPDVFVLDSKRKSTVVEDNGAPLAKVLEAAEACPCAAIEVDDDSGESLFP
jgi:ferredoxin